LWPDSTCSSFTPRAARSFSRRRQVDLAVGVGQVGDGGAAGFEGGGSFGAFIVPMGRIDPDLPARNEQVSVGGVCSRLSTTTRCGCRGVSTSRTSSRGLSSSTVPTPVSTALARARQAWPSVRAASAVIHWLTPLARPVLPSSDAATFMRTQGCLRTMRLKKPMLSSRASAAPGPTSTSTPAARSRPKPWPATSGFGSASEATTRRTPAAINASQHGPVRPWCEQGSSVT
jgi:hypothetical protein